MGQMLSHPVDRHVDPFDVDPNEVSLQSTDLDVVSELHHSKEHQDSSHKTAADDPLRRKIQELNQKTEDTSLKNYPMMPPPEITKFKK